jgi:hypothetical protein
VDVTDARGRFTIHRLGFGPYHDLTVDRRGFDVLTRPLVRVDGTVRIRMKVSRDWAAIDGGAHITSFTGPNYAPDCGPPQALDRRGLYGWSTKRFGPPGPALAVIKLPRPVDVRSFGVDPGAVCGDTSRAAVRAFDIHTRTRRGRWVRAYRNTTTLSEGALHRLEPRAGDRRVAAVKIVLRTNRGDRRWIDLTELSVRGSAA